MTRRTMSGADAMWLHADRPNHLMIIDGIMWTEEPLDRDELEQVLQQRLIDHFPVFRQRPVEPRFPWELPSWEDDPDFSLRRHVHQARLRNPGGDRQLRAFMEKHVSVPLDPTRPLWEMWLVDNYRGGSVVYSRLHHAMADGMALAQVMLTLTDPAPDAPDVAVPPAQPHPVGLGWLVNDGIALARSAVGLVGLPIQGVRSVGVARKLLFSNLTRTLLSGEPGNAKRMTWSRPRQVEDIKAVGRATGCTVNDVLVAGLAGGLSRFLADHGEAAEQLSTMVPVNTRPPHRPLPAELGNQFSLVLLHLPTGDQPPEERLREVHRRMEAIKHSPEPLITSVMAQGIGHLSTAEGPFVDFFAGKAFGVTTNVAGPREPRYLAGKRVSGVLGWVPGSGRQTLGVCIYSYAGEVRIGFKVDVATVPDPDRLVECFDAELDALGALVVAE